MPTYRVVVSNEEGESTWASSYSSEQLHVEANICVGYSNVFITTPVSNEKPETAKFTQGNATPARGTPNTLHPLL
jgi:hypothetical protein